MPKKQSVKQQAIKPEDENELFTRDDFMKALEKIVGAEDITSKVVEMKVKKRVIGENAKKDD